MASSNVDAAGNLVRLCDVDCHFVVSSPAVGLIDTLITICRSHHLPVDVEGY